MNTNENHLEYARSLTHMYRSRLLHSLNTPPISLYYSPDCINFYNILSLYWCLLYTEKEYHGYNKVINKNNYENAMFIKKKRML